MKSLGTARHFSELSCPRKVSLGGAIAVVLLALTFFGSDALAQGTWDGGGVNDDWDTVANWNDNLLPGATANILFGTFGTNSFSSGTSIDTIASRTMNSLTISTIVAFSLSGGDTLTITSGALTRNDVTGIEGNHTIIENITLGAAGNFTINGSGTLTINGV